MVQQGQVQGRFKVRWAVSPSFQGAGFQELVWPMGTFPSAQVPGRWSSLYLSRLPSA